MNFKVFFAILLISTLGYSQKSGFDFVRAEKKARSLISKHPDSAIVYVRQILSHKNLHDTIYGSSYFLYGVYSGFKGNKDSLIYYQKKSIAYFANYPISKAKSLLNLSIGYRDKADYKTAIKHLHEALEIAQKNKNNLGIAMVYGELASNYTYMLEYDKSIDYLLKALHILKTDKNVKRATPIKQKLGNTYLNKKKFKTAIDLFRESMVEFKQQEAMKNYYITEINLADALIQSKDLKGARTALNDALAGMKTFDDKAMIGMCYAKYGNLERDRKNYAGAAVYYKKALSYLTSIRSNWIVAVAADYIKLLNDQKKYNEGLGVIATIEKLKVFNTANLEEKMLYNKATADTYSGSDRAGKAIDAYKRTIAIKDSIYNLEKKTAIEEAQAKFQTELQQEKNVVLEANNKALQKTMETEKARRWLYVILRVSILIFILLILRSYWLKNRLQKVALKAVASEKSLLEQKHLHEQELTTAQREIINEKQRELTATALRMASYQDGVVDVINKCDATTKLADVKKDLQQLVKQQDYWKQFETRFNSLHPEFGYNLSAKFNKLTKNDIEFCSLLKLNLSNKEIASLLQISHESTITKKYRIKKKMEINDDEEFEKLLREI